MRRLSVRPFATIALLTCAVACGDDPPTGASDVTAPTNVRATVTGADRVTVTWTRGSNIVTQRVELETTGEMTRTSAVSAVVTSTDFTGLTSGVTYTATVTSIGPGGSEAAAAAVSVTVDIPTVSEITGDILNDMTLTNDRTWLMTGPVFVGRDVDGASGVPVTLTIDPGTTVLFNTTPPPGTRGSMLVVSRGSRIIADANANRPSGEQSMKPDAADVIVMTSSSDRGSRARGDWGGLVINGRAPLNSGAEALGEGESGLYGGPDEMDDSGILRGVRVEFAGDDADTADQLNGIAFQGVGAGTTVDWIQVHSSVDDGIEPFGGTVSITHVVLTAIGDDSFDGTDGWRGFSQYVVIQQFADDADQGFEISNNGGSEDAVPHTSAIVANATAVGAGTAGGIAALGSESGVGVLFREGSNGRLFNNIVTGFREGGLCIENAQTIVNADRRLGGSTDPDSTLRFEGNILWNNVGTNDDDNFAAACNGGAAGTFERNRDFFQAAGFNNVIADPTLPASAFEVGSMASPPNVIPTGMPVGYVAFDVSTLNGEPGLVMPTDGRALVATTYAGAVAPGTSLADAWYAGWTVWAPDGSDSRPGLGEL
ncbi:MAG TPA: fibronectin type III domain-containing protein [Longimicrobiales bacterium]|nr:fibronectin type III domain-containing protein [Longimicrobiales bacterium]